MAVGVAESQEGAVVDMHIIAFLDAAKAQQVGIATAIAEQHIVAKVGAVQLASGGIAAQQFYPCTQAIALVEALHFNGDGEITHLGCHHHGHRARPIILGTGEIRAGEQIVGCHHLADLEFYVNDVVADIFRVVVAHIAGLGPEILEILGIFLLEHVGNGGPQPDLAHGHSNHEFITPRVAEAVQIVEFFTLMAVEAKERIAAATGLHGVDHLGDLGAQYALHIEHGAEVDGLLGADAVFGAVLGNHAAAHERQRALVYASAVLQTQG